METGAMSQMIAILGVSHKDVESGAFWRWIQNAHRLNTDINKVVCVFTQKAWGIEPPHGVIQFQCFRLHDECENGYPRSASHLFQRSIEHAEKTYPGRPILWLECDAIPTHEGWLEAIEVEYESCGAKFMGHLEPNIRPPHMAGCGVYPPNWRELAPSLGRVIDAPDIPSWGHGKGQAWDTFAAHEIYPRAAQAETIKQVWNCPPFTRAMMPMIEGVSLFHPSKDGRLIALLDGTTKEPEPIDVVYPVKAHGWWEHELMWSLRSLEKHAAHLIRDVYVIGDVPAWYTGKAIPFNSRETGNADQVRKLLEVVAYPEISERFLWANNDFICQSEPDLSIVAHMRGKPTSPRVGGHKTYMANTVAILDWMNRPCTRDFELHVPMPMTKTNVRDMAGLITMGNIAFRTLYGNLYCSDSVPMNDVKLRNWRQKPQPEWTWFSTDDALFEARGSDMQKYLNDLCPTPSRWERSSSQP